MDPKKNLVALVMTLYACTAGADDPDTSMFTLSSFGTVGIVHSSEKKADFAGTFKPNGAGYSRSWSADVDSLIGAQLSANFTPQLSAVVQVISEQRYDNSYRPFLEWANVKYQFTPDFGARIGRIVLPVFLLSDTRKVGYTTPWVRPPEEVYSLIPITSSDGMDVSYRFHINDITNTLQGNYGQNDSQLPDDMGSVMARELWGITNTTEFGTLTTRITYMQADLSSSRPNPFLGNFDVTPLEFFGMGASYDPGQWFVMGEWGRITIEPSIAKRNAWYVSAGYRVDLFTPYITYARVKSDQENNEGQQTLSLGLRWDFTKNMDAKLQYDYTRLKDNAIGPLSNIQPDFEPGGSFNLISLAVDFVF